MNIFKTFALTGAIFLASTVFAQATFKVTAIPDENPTELQRKFKPLGAYLE